MFSLRVSVGALVCGLIMGVFTSRAEAMPITYDYAGECASSNTLTCASLGLTDGDPITGSISFDDTNFAPFAVITTSDVLTFSFDTGIFVISDATVEGFNFAGILAADGMTFSSFSAQMADALAPATGNGLNIDDFSDGNFGPHFRCDDADCGFFSGAELPIAEVTNQSLTKRVVPEPAALALIGFGLAGLGLARFRNHSKILM